MDKNIKEFLEEMDQLTKEGVFGDEAKLYSYLKDKIELENFFIKVFMDWLNKKNQLGKENVHKIISLLLKLYYDSIKVNSEKTTEIMGYFINGYPGVSESDIVTPLYSWFQSLTNFRESLPTGKNPSSPFQVAQNMITTYQKGVELVNRILIVLLCMQYEIKGIKYNPKEIFELSLFKKTEKFTEIFGDKYLVIISLIDRHLRNSESHLDLRYSRIQCKIIYIIRKRKNTKIIKLPVENFIINYFPNPGHIIQGYLFSMMLFLAIGGMHSSEIKNIVKGLK